MSCRGLVGCRDRARHQRGIRSVTEGASEVAFNSDDGLLRQLVANLLDDAVRAARPSGTVVAVCTANLTESSLTVVDDGPGVAAANRERLFERFVRRRCALEGRGPPPDVAK